MPDSLDDLEAFDTAFARILAACRDEDHALTESESRVLAAAFAQIGTPLENWGGGVDVADSVRLVQDTQWLLDAASIIRAQADPHRYHDDARNALHALLGYFQTRALNRPTRVDYLRELGQLYTRELEFLRAHGHTPHISWTDDGHSARLVAPLDDKHEIHATNGHGCLNGSHTEQIDGNWAVGVYELGTDHVVTNHVDRRFDIAYTNAIASLPTRPTKAPCPFVPGSISDSQKEIEGAKEDETETARDLR
ncbi:MULTISPECIES: hypothetical protein [Nocardia]|uniref:hypothetical protein n=1 Tax=Nocardia TaxID=1817 RepID=UPI0013007A2E|nr:MULTISPECIES: hypothetical protein [Nocardia]